MFQKQLWYMLAPDGGGAAGGTPPATPPVTPPAGTGSGTPPPPGTGRESTLSTVTGATPPVQTPPVEPTPPAPPAGKTMTQEEFNTALAARLKKYADYDDLKKAADKYKVIEDANKTELEKEREKVAQAQTAAAQAQTKATQLEAQARESTLRGAVIAEAAKQGFADPMDAYKLLDMAKMGLGEDGTVKGLTEALTALATAKPYLRQKNALVVPPANPSRDSGSQERTDEDRRRDYFGGGRTDFWNPEGRK